MKKRILTLGVLFSLLMTNCIEPPIPENAPQTVESVDVERYMGKWYEIASYPQFFSQECNCTTAEYRLLDNGNVGVVNTCNLFTTGGPVSVANGTAVPVEGANGSRLTVSFLPNNTGSMNGNYWILELDEEYTYAVVSGPFRSTWFLLSRTPTMPQAQVDAIIDRAVADGFNRNQIRITDQNCQ